MRISAPQWHGFVPGAAAVEVPFHLWWSNFKMLMRWWYIATYIEAIFITLEKYLFSFHLRGFFADISSLILYWCIFPTISLANVVSSRAYSSAHWLQYRIRQLLEALHLIAIIGPFWLAFSLAEFTASHYRCFRVVTIYRLLPGMQYHYRNSNAAKAFFIVFLLDRGKLCQKKIFAEQLAYLYLMRFSCWVTLRPRKDILLRHFLISREEVSFRASFSRW